MRPSASARASVRIEVEAQRRVRVFRHAAGQLVLDRPDEFSHAGAHRDIRLAFFQRGGQIDFSQRGVARRPLRLDRVNAQTFEPNIVGAALRRRLHLVAQTITIGDEPRMQWRRPRQDNPHRKEPPFRRLGMRAHFCLDRAKKPGLIAVRCCVDEDLRPARRVRHNAAHIRNNPVSDVYKDRPPLSAFSDAAALQIAGIDDPWIARDDFERVDMAESPIVVTARRQVGGRARRIVFVAGAAAGGVQDADVEPASQGFWVVDSVVLNHLTVRKTASVQRDAQILDAVGFRPPGRKLENVVRPGQGFGEEAFSIMIAPQQERWNAAIREARQLPVQEEGDRGVLPFAVKNVAGDHDERNAFLQRLRDKVFECASTRLGKARGNIFVLQRKAEERAAEMKISGVQETKIHPRASTKAVSVAPSINSASRESRSAGAASGNSRWTS